MSSRLFGSGKNTQQLCVPPMFKTGSEDTFKFSECWIGDHAAGQGGLAQKSRWISRQLHAAMVAMDAPKQRFENLKIPSGVHCAEASEGTGRETAGRPSSGLPLGGRGAGKFFWIRFLLGEVLRRNAALQNQASVQSFGKTCQARGREVEGLTIRRQSRSPRARPRTSISAVAMLLAKGTRFWSQRREM